jgi:hypothetical protein
MPNTQGQYYKSRRTKGCKFYNISGKPQKARGLLRKTFKLERFDIAMQNAMDEEFNIRFVNPRSLRAGLLKTYRQHKLSELANTSPL